MLRACEQLAEEYYVLEVTLQTGVNMTSSTAFWESLSSNLKSKWPHLPTFSSSTGFADIFKESNRDTLFDGKDVVLFIDEFDLIEQLSDFDDILHTLRGLKQDRPSKCLQAVVAIGPFSILQLDTERRGSPFNVADAVAVQLFDEAEVIDLFKQLSTARGTDIDTAVARDVFMRTNGHPGLVCFCGKMVDENLLGGSTEPVTLEKWDAWRRKELVNQLKKWPSLRKMAKLLEAPATLNDALRTLVNEAREFLVKDVLPYGKPVIVPRGKTLLANFLVAEGALQLHSEGKVSVRNELVYEVLLDEIVMTHRMMTPRAPFPDLSTLMTPDGIVDMLNSALESVSAAIIAGACKKAFKIYKKQRVPNEYTYHHELSAVLKFWAPPEGPNVYCESRALGAARADIFLETPDTGQGVVLELMASGDEEQVAKHINRVGKYRAERAAGAAHVIHFIADWPPPLAPRRPAADDSVGLVNVYHDASFTNWKTVVIPSC